MQEKLILFMDKNSKWFANMIKENVIRYQKRLR